MQLTTAQIKYILVIHELQPIVRLGQIARRLQVSKPSVHRMLGRLKNRQLIELDEKGLPRMTEIGAEMAQRYAKQYRTMLDFFTGIMQMKNSVAEESAAVLLGSQSESIQELCQCMQQFEKTTQQSQHAVGQWRTSLKKTQHKKHTARGGDEIRSERVLRCNQ